MVTALSFSLCFVNVVPMCTSIITRLFVGIYILFLKAFKTTNSHSILLLELLLEDGERGHI